MHSFTLIIKDLISQIIPNLFSNSPWIVLKGETERALNWKGVQLSAVFSDNLSLPSSLYFLIVLSF